MKKYFSHLVFATFIMVTVLTFSSLLTPTSASAQSMSLCQTIEALISAGVINPDKAAAALLVTGCSVPNSVISTTTACTDLISRDLNMGSTGAEVVSLQNFLTVQGYGKLTGTGYFGAATKVAVIKFQQAKGLSPTGFVGILTRTLINKMNCPVATIVVPPVTNQTVPTAIINNSPTLKLTYDSRRKESMLTANFKVSIDAASGEVKLPLYLFSVGLINTANTNNGVSSAKTVTTGVSGVENDGQYYIIREGDKGIFDVTFTAKPSELFAGQYFARLYGSFLPAYDTTLEISPAQNASYMVTVVGETSPYITSATFVSNITSGFDGVKVMGARLGGPQYADIKCDNTGGISNKPLKLDSTSASYVAVDDLPAGGTCMIQIINTTTGASNTVSFNVNGDSTQASITVTSPNGGETLKKGSTYTIRWNSNQAASSEVYIKLRKGGDTYQGTEGSVVTDTPNTGRYNWTIPTTLPAGSDYAIRVISSSATGVLDDSDSTFNIVSSVESNDEPVAVINNSPTLKLTYDSRRKESMLTANFKVSIDAASGEVKLPLYLFSVGLINTANTNNGVSSAKTVTTGVSGVENDGQYYIIREGDKGIFDVTFTAKPSELFAGQYFARLYGSFLPAYDTTLEISPAQNASYMVTVVGETSPYITKVTYDAIGKGGNPTITVIGSRLANSKVYIDGNVLSNITTAVPIGGNTLSFVIPSSLSNGSHTLYLVNSSTGKSNNNTFSVEGDSTQPSISILSPNGGEKITQGQQSSISWTGQRVIKISAFLVPASSPYDGSTPLGLIGSVASSYPNITWDGKTVISSNGTTINVSPGSYKIYIVGYFGNSDEQSVSDRSNNYFTITAPTSVTQPSISILSPNSGEIYISGKSVINIKYISSNMLGSKLTANLYHTVRGSVRSVSAYANNSGTIDMDLGKGDNDIPGDYKISLCSDVYTEGKDVCDISDNYLTITAPTPVTQPTTVTASSIAIEGNQSVYSAGQEIKYSVRAIAPDGSTGDPSRGFSVQYRLDRGFSQNATYNSNTGLWDVTLTAPTDTSSHTLDSIFYCSPTGFSDSCQDMQLNKSFNFTVSSPTTAVDGNQNYATASAGWESFLKLLQVLR